MLNGEKRAVKIPLANCSDPDGAVADLTNEIRILKRLRHPHLCSVYGAGGWRTEGELPFLVLERLQYKNLAQQVKTPCVNAHRDCSTYKSINRVRYFVLFGSVSQGWLLAVFCPPQAGRGRFLMRPDVFVGRWQFAHFRVSSRPTLKFCSKVHY